MAQYGVVLVTIDDEQQGQAIATAIVAARLAACVNLFPVQSIYRWQGEIQRDQEWQLVIKTDLAQYPALAAKIQSLHPYDLPEIIALPIAQGSEAYLAWISAQVEGTGERS